MLTRYYRIASLFLEDFYTSHSFDVREFIGNDTLMNSRVAFYLSKPLLEVNLNYDLN